VTITGINSARGIIYVFTGDSRLYWNVYNGSGADNTAGTSWSITTGTTISSKPGDLIFSGGIFTNRFNVFNPDKNVR
jgi:hypothetical protein